MVNVTRPTTIIHLQNLCFNFHFVFIFVIFIFLYNYLLQLRTFDNCTKSVIRMALIV